MAALCRHATTQCRRRVFFLLMAWVGFILAIASYTIFADHSKIRFAFINNPYSATSPQLPRGISPPNNRTRGAQDCKGFDLDPFDKSIAKYFRKQAPLSCKRGTPNLLYATEDGTRLIIDKKKAASLKVSVDYCKYASVQRRNGIDDLQTTTSSWSKTFTESITLPTSVEHILGQCFHARSLVGNGYISIIRKKPDVEESLKKSYDAHVKKENPKETLSVLMIGIDGTSKQNFARQMPKTKSYVLDEMKAIEFYRVNKVGINTFPNVIPLLSGHSEEEIRKTWNDKEHFDKLDHLFILEEARSAGYRTSVVLDMIKVSAFHWLKLGWRRPKFHYYNRPVVVHSERDRVARAHSPYCVADKDKVTLFYDYWLQMTKTFNNSQTTPYFGYSFFAHITHDDINKASTIDHIYLQLFKNLVAQRSLNNTLIIFFSDHGARFGTFRGTFKGMLEDSNPFMFFIFPPWFEPKYPKVMTNFRKNQHRVLTNFDLHATLKDVLYFKGDDLVSRKVNGTRGLSLFQELPANRTCEEAGIPIKYCNCRNFSSLGITPQLSQKISAVLLKSIVLKTDRYRKQCVTYSLNSTISVMTIFTTFATEDHYQGTIQTSQGGALFEATLKKKKSDSTGDTLAVVGDIARLNMYRGQADCVNDARTRPYCYCNNLL